MGATTHPFAQDMQTDSASKVIAARADSMYRSHIAQNRDLAERTDARILRGSHPVRARASQDSGVGDIARVLGPQWEAFATRIRERHNEPTTRVLPKIFHEFGLHRMMPAIESMNFSASSTSGGGAIAAMLTIRSGIDAPDHYLIDDGLLELLLRADISDDIPMRYLRATSPRMYIEFGTRRDTGIHIHNPASGLHQLEGAHIEIVGVDEPGGDHRPCMAVVLTGSPLGRNHPLDDATLSLVLPLWDENISLNAAIESNIAQSRALGMRFNPTPARFWGDARTAANLLAKALLYIGMPSIRCQVVTEYSDAMKRLEQKSGHKAAKLRRQAFALRDCTRITMPRPAMPGSTLEGGRSVAAHWRRPHFRLQHHGTQNSLTKVVLIDGVVVNPTGGAITESPRHYRVTT